MMLTLLAVLSLMAIEYDGAVVTLVDCFSPRLTAGYWTTHHINILPRSRQQLYSRAPSRVSDPSGPTADDRSKEMNVVNIEDIPEAHYDESKIPIPHQPWRRGETAGCEDPIDSPWRKKAEQLIKLGVEDVGGTYVDTT